MKTDNQIGTVAFSHRPQDGITVGIVVVAGVAYMAASFVREGDHFSRRLARRIVTQRLISTLENTKRVNWVAAVSALPEGVDTRDIIREFRKLFKPDPTQNDAQFVAIGKFGSVTTRSPLSRDLSWDRVQKLFETAVVTANKAKCVS